MPPEVSLVVESYNHGEGSPLERFELALGEASRIVEEHGGAELLVADPSGDPAIVELLATRFPHVRRIDASGLGYDAAKMRAASEATGRYVVYLDGDCVPAPGWLDAHLTVLRAGVPASAGFTRYDGGFLGAVESVLDFGFLLPAEPREVHCYAFNNVGFRSDLLRAAPIPEGPMRCQCYAHAELLFRRGTPVRLTPAARARHERQPIVRERFRQGFDAIGACWADPELPQTRLLGLGVLAAPLFYARAVLLDWRRLRAGWRNLGLSRGQVPLAAALLPLLRVIDFAGMVKALAPGGRETCVGLEHA